MLIENKTLESIQCNYCQFGPEGCRSIAEGMQDRPWTLSNLKMLGLAGNALGDAGVEEIAQVLRRQEVTLTHINLAENGLTD